jgi:hypothetical protein
MHPKLAAFFDFAYTADEAKRQEFVFAAFLGTVGSLIAANARQSPRGLLPVVGNTEAAVMRSSMSMRMRRVGRRRGFAMLSGT